MRRLATLTLALLALGCAEDPAPTTEPVDPGEPEATAPDPEPTGPIESEDPLELLDRPELDPEPQTELPPGDPSDGFAPAPEGDAAPPDPAGFRERYGRWLRLDEVARVPDRHDVVEYRVTAIAPRGTVRLALHTSWPRLFPEERVVELCASNAARRLDARARHYVVCDGDRLHLRVPVTSPPAEWADAPGGGADPVEDTSRPLAAIPDERLPAAVRALSPEFGDARSRARSDELHVTYWVRAEHPGAVALALPLHFPSPALSVLTRGAPVTEYVDFAAGGWFSPPPRELRIGDAVAIGFLRP
ncbi:MAG: hypothetical protein H6719_32050 [Sandaracinaceae bacterium]|nr:hypothetical protein [Sandaracinaceae bacterium]